MRDITAELDRVQETIAQQTPALDIAPTLAVLDGARAAVDARAQIDATIALERQLRALQQARKAARGAHTPAAYTISVIANRMLGLIDAMAGENPHLIRVFGSFPDRGLAAGDIDLVLPPFSDHAIEQLAALSTSGPDDVRWIIPGDKLVGPALTTEGMKTARWIALLADMKVDVFFGSNAFNEFAVGATFDPARNLWTVTDRWCPDDDFFAGQRTATRNDLAAMAGVGARAAA